MRLGVVITELGGVIEARPESELEPVGVILSLRRAELPHVGDAGAQHQRDVSILAGCLTGLFVT